MKHARRFLTFYTVFLGSLGLMAPLPVSAQDDAQPAPAVESPDGAAGDAGADAAATGTTKRGQEFFEKLKKGGITIFFLLLLSIAGIAFAIERFIFLRRSLIIPLKVVDEAEAAWGEADNEQVTTICEKKYPSTLGKVIHTLSIYRGYPTGDLHPLASEIAGRDFKKHMQKAYPLAVIGAIAPLLGLMGTVFGMIESFEVVAIAGSLGDASILADGISKALITTAAGLVIAIPMLLLYHFFKNRTMLFAITLEEEVNEFIKRRFLKPSGDAK